MKKILISGISGSGKSTVCTALAEFGYEAHGIEDIDGMFAMYHKGTHKPFDDFDNGDPEKIQDSEWLCDPAKLKELLAGQRSQMAFYCGVASNMDDIIPLFDCFIILRTDSKTLHARLLSRAGTDDMGATEASRQAVLGWKDWWENEMLTRGAKIIDATDTPENVARSIIAQISG